MFEVDEGGMGSLFPSSHLLYLNRQWKQINHNWGRGGPIGLLGQNIFLNWSEWFHYSKDDKA